jgi:uncharacterized repeat protein (TIGR01451 family)
MSGGAIRRRVLQRALAASAATAVISGLLLSTGVSPVGAGASAVGPCGGGTQTSDATTITCTYDHTGASDFFSRPLDVSTYTVKVYGAQGGSAAQSDFLIRGQGGKGALAQATVSDLSLGVYVGHAGSSSVTAGTNPIGSTYGGGAGGSTGTTFYGHAAGGGAASVVVASSYSIVGGGGGGGGATGPGSRGTGGGPGGVGGDPNGTDGEEGGGDCCSQAGTGGTATFNLDGGNGGSGGTPTTPGGGGAGGGGTTNVSFRAGTAGGSAVGTNGGAGGGGATDSGFRTQDGGGGGGGVTGGGGGGSGSGSNGFGLSGGSGGGGGGGGASGGPAGVTLTEGVREGNGQVVITWSIPAASAGGDSYTATLNTDLVVPSPGVLTNDTAGATAVKLTDPSHGSVTLGSDGGFTYSPETDYTGPDSFTYKATKAGLVDSAAATVSISVENDKADLSLGKSCGPTPVGPGQTVSCTVTVTNGGPADAANVVVTDDLPAQLSKVAFGTTDGYSCATQASSPEISCTKASESVGTSTINYTAVVSADTGPGMALTNSAAVASDTVDTDSDDLTATATINTPTCTIDSRTARSGQTIRGTSGDDVICGSPFADTINAGAGADFVFAGAGNDSVSGKDGPDKIFGGDGKDTLQGDAGDDQVYGGADNDKITTGDGIDLADGRSGTDTCSAETVVRCER